MAGQHSLEARLDALDGAAGTASLALEEEDPRLFQQHGLRRPTGVARHILLCEGVRVV